MNQNELFREHLSKSRDDALTWLNNMFYDRLHAAALSYTGNRHDAEDLCQDTFVVAVQYAHKFRGDSAVYTWLYGILLKLISRMRRKKADGLSAKTTDEFIQNRTQDPAVVAEQNETVIQVRKTVESLPEDMKQLVLMRYQEGFSGQEMASLLSMSHGRVRSRLSEARALLRERLIR